MAQSGFTPISLYYSSTGAAVPSAGNLVAGELALNTNDGKLYYKNSSGVVTLLAGATSGPAGGSTTQVQYNNAGVLAGITGATTNGTALTLTAPVLGTPASGTVTNLTGTASININGTVGNLLPAAGAFTTLSATGTSTLAAVNASGNITISKALPILTLAATTGTNASYHALTNTGNTTYIGLEDSVGGFLLAGTTAYDNVIAVTAGRNFRIGTSNAIRLTIDSSGAVSIPGTLAAGATTVTGTLSASGQITASATGGGVTFASTGGQNIRMYGGSASHQWDVYGNGTNLRFSDNTGGGNVVIDTDVGIGTSSPGSRLELAQSAAAATGPILFLHNTAATQAGAVGNLARITFGLDTGASASGGNAYILAQEDGLSSYAASIQFGVSDGASGAAERMRLTSTGLAVTGTLSATAGKLTTKYNTTTLSAGSEFSNEAGTVKAVITPINAGSRVGIQTYLSSVASGNLTLQEGGGNVGIGTTGPNYNLEIGTDSAGKPGVGGLWTVVSDERIKANIVPANLDRCYEIVKSVPLKHFGFAPGVYTDDQIQDKHNLGWIAQDVQKVFKNAVSVKPFTPAIGDVIEDCLDLNSGQMIAALYGCVQALIAKVEALEAK